MIYLSNAFSLSMLKSVDLFMFQPVFKRMTAEQAASFLSSGIFISGIGHADTADLLETVLGTSVDCARINIELKMGDYLIVAQYVGKRLPEGTTVLPEGCYFDFYGVTLNDLELYEQQIKGYL